MSESPKFDAGKAPVHLVVPQFILGIAQVMGFGAKKYPAWSWAKGKEWSRDYSAVMRHILMFWAGQDLDPESGLHHLLHAGCDIMFLFVSWLKGLGTDDRHKFPPDVLDRMNTALMKAAEELHEEKRPPSKRLVAVKANYTVYVAAWLEGKCAWCWALRKPAERYFCTAELDFYDPGLRRCEERCAHYSSVAEFQAACDYAEKHGVEA